MNRLAKAMSAFTPGRSASADGRDARSFAGRGASLRADGSGAPSLALAGRFSTVGTFLAATLLTMAVGLVLAGSARADGTVELTVQGAGVVTSTSVHALGPPPFGGTSSATPGEIDCDGSGEAPHDTCSAHFDFTAAFGTNDNGSVTLTAEPGPGQLLGGWSVSFSGSGGSQERCTTPPGADPTCVIHLNGDPGPTATVTATFIPPPDPPLATTGPATDVDDFGAVLSGRVNPLGFEGASCRFEYGTTPDYGAVAPCEQTSAEIGGGNEDVQVSSIGPPHLEAGTTYHYRLVAENLGGASHGESRSFTTSGSPRCSNADRRLEQGIGSILLPDCMALEMVSPPMKFNQRAGLATKVSVGADRVQFKAAGALADPPSFPIFATDYVATRHSDGWATGSAAPADPNMRGHAGIPTAFTPDLTRWLHTSLGTDEALASSVGQTFANGLDGILHPISPPITVSGSASGEQIGFEGASRDLSRAFIRPVLTGAGGLASFFLPDDPRPAPSGADRNTYVAAGGAGAAPPTLHLLGRDRHGKAWGGNCGTRFGSTRTEAVAANPGSNGPRNQGAVSTDGSHVYFMTRPAQPEAGPCDFANKLRIMTREETDEGVEIAELFTDPAAGGDDFFQGASVDQSKVYFTTNRRLSDTDTDSGADCANAPAAVTACDLYLYDSSRDEGERIVHVSDGGPGVSAQVLNGVPAISTDGSRVYFVAKGVLTDGENPEGASPVAGQPNLYTWSAEDGALAFVATLHSSDGGAGGLWGQGGTFTNFSFPVPANGSDGEGNEVGGSGEILVFRSSAPLTGDDTDGARADLFRYDSAAKTLVRVSKAAPGGEDGGPFDVEVNRQAQPPGPDERRTWVSEDGQAVVFSTYEHLVPGGIDEVRSSYIWRGAQGGGSEGELHRLPGARRPAGQFETPATVTMSPDGSTVAYDSNSRLLPADGDSAEDIYVARAGGGFEPDAVPPSCLPDASGGCQGPVAAQPGPLGAASVARFAGNPTLRRRCNAIARRAGVLRQRAQRLRRQATRTSNRRQARRQRARARQSARQATRLSRNARVCRRQARRAER